MLDKWKRQDDGPVKAKSRIVLVGWKDPMVYQLERPAPTPTQKAIMVWLASAKVSGQITDLTNVFDQSRKTSRRNKLGTGLPPGVTHPSVGPRQLLLVETEIYGLVSGPSWLRASLTVDLLAAVYVKNPYDKCLFTLFSDEDTSEGQVLNDVVDFIEGGRGTHRKSMESFCEKYRCGKSIDLWSVGHEGTLFAGKRIVQQHEYRVTVSLDEYVRNKLRPIEVPGICRIPKKSVRECSPTLRGSMVVWAGLPPLGDQTWRHHIRSSRLDTIANCLN